ncbi:hypothetical protein QYF36_018816 [Acer negundo]|nr:hypothetical protein QYF36_018816 [Acer negundo]
MAIHNTASHIETDGMNVFEEGPTPTLLLTKKQTCSTWVDMSHLPGKQPPPWRTQAQPKYQEEGNRDQKGDKCGTNTNSMYEAVVKAPYILKMRVEPSSFDIQHNYPPVISFKVTFFLTQEDVYDEFLELVDDVE